MIRVGLVGFGMAGRVFHGPLLASVEGFELAAVVERTSNHAAARYPAIKTCRSLDEMLADASLDLFVLATPSGTHFEVARHILRAGRNVLVDKPLAVRSTEIAELIALAAEKNVLLVPFQNRRFDGDFLTIKELLRTEAVGQLVFFESRFDRWRPHAPANRLWKEDIETGGGVLLDLGTHLADQALILFGKPEAVSAHVLCERAWARVDDGFEIRLRYPGFTVALGANCLSLPASPRFHLRGSKGNFWKYFLDPQEAALNHVTHITDPDWGRDLQAGWGTLYLDGENGAVTQSIETLTGDYRRFYAALRDALLGKSAPPATAGEAWRTARLLEWVRESSSRRCEVACDWRDEPK
jgi:scyllo-inositol 2-dehydrogenase (NADP+)